MTSIVLAEDHQIVRQGCKALLEHEPDLCVIGEAKDGVEAVTLVKQLSPDVLVLDLMIPRLHGLEVIRQVVANAKATKVVVLSMHGEEPFVRGALQNGALGYVLKDCSSEDLVQAVRAVVGGHRYLTPMLNDLAIRAFADSEMSTKDGYEKLTHRERLVMHLASEGLNNAEIGEKLTVSPRTVETHRSNLMSKLGLSNQTDLVRFAIRKGFLEP